MTNYQPNNPEPRPRGLQWNLIIFAIVGFLVPPIGAVIAAYFLTKKEPADQSNGRFILIWSAIGFLAYLIHYLLTR